MTPRYVYPNFDMKKILSEKTGRRKSNKI